MDARTVRGVTDVEISNVAVVCPSATVTEVGRVTSGDVDFKITVAPPTGAATFNVTFPTEVFPLTMDDGANVTLFGVTRLTRTVVPIPASSASASMAAE
jgi:hypothetical protein